jgi:hypothetical protein
MTQMTQTTGSIPTTNLRVLGELLELIGRSRRDDDMTADDVIIVLAIGHLSISETRFGLVLTSTTCIDVTRLVGIPRETVRRRAARLAERGVLEVSGRGLRLIDIAAWQSLSRKLSACFDSEVEIKESIV